MERVAPRQLLYENQLPVAIESTSSRRIFFPEGGSKYGPTGAGANPNIVRIPINSNDLLDCQESFLQFKFTNTGANTLGLDIGVPFIRRLRIESGGTTLEDINEYGKLYAQLVACQASQGAITEATLTTGGINGNNTDITPMTALTDDRYNQTDGAIATAVLGAFTGNSQDANTAANTTAITNAKAAATTVIRDAVRAASNAQNAEIKTNVDALTLNAAGVHNQNDQLVQNASVYYNIPLVSGLLNMEKYLPLVMMNAGLTIELEFDDVGTAGSFSANDNNCAWEIDDVRYVAHMISLQRDFYDKLRLVMEGSGGVLQLAGTTYRHFQGDAADATQTTVAIPAKVKSIKGMLFTMNEPADKTHKSRFGVSNSIPNGLEEYQFRIGSVVYPPTAVKVNQGTGGFANTYRNKGEAYQELRKLFGTLGDYTHGGVLLNSNTYLAATNTGTARQGAAGVVNPILNPFGMSFESFPRTALESGVNSADRNLSINLDIKRSQAPATNTTVNVWAMCDAIYYVNLDGSVSVSV